MRAFADFIQKNKKKHKNNRLYARMMTNTQSGWHSFDYSTLSKIGYENNVIVHRAVTLIARSIAGIPWHLYKGTEQIINHPLLSLLHKPNPNQGGNVFIESIVSYLLLSGNAYVEAIHPTDGGSIIELHTLRPDRLKIIPGPYGMPERYEYRVNNTIRTINIDPVTGNSNLLHLKFFHPLSDWYGLSPLEAALKSIDSHNTVSRHNLSLLENGGRPSGALLVNNKGRQQLTSEQRETLRENLKSMHQGSQNAGEIMVLEGDFEWKEMGFSPKEMDFSSGKNISAREISQVFGVPPMLVGIPGDATFSNYKEARLHLWEDTILPLLNRLTNQFNSWLTPEFDPELKIKYNPDDIPSIAAKRELVWDTMKNCHFLTLNEKRAALGYPPLADGDVLPFKERNHD